MYRNIEAVSVPTVNDALAAFVIDVLIILPPVLPFWLLITENWPVDVTYLNSLLAPKTPALLYCICVSEPAGLPAPPEAAIVKLG